MSQVLLPFQHHRWYQVRLTLKENERNGWNTPLNIDSDPKHPDHPEALKSYMFMVSLSMHVCPDWARKSSDVCRILKDYLHCFFLFYSDDEGETCIIMLKENYCFILYFFSYLLILSSSRLLITSLSYTCTKLSNNYPFILAMWTCIVIFSYYLF